MAALSDSARPLRNGLHRLGLGLVLVLALCMLVCSPAGAQNAAAPRESAVKAAFLYKFSSFTEWPPATFRSAGQPFVIGVYGDDEVASDLEKLVAGRTLEGRPVLARRVRELSPDAGIQILFLGAQKGARLHELLAATAGPTLVVTDQEGALDLGSVINFSTEAGRVRFSVSLSAAEARSLKLSARLLTVALNVQGRPR